jgi:hypothetical protein
MRYFIGFLVTIGLIVLIIVLLLGGGGSKGSQTAAPKPLSLVDYANGDTAAQIIIDGPVVADQNHKMLKINVSQERSELTIYNGYEQNVVSTQTFPNNPTSYAIFLQSLQHANFTLHDTKGPYDERGYCPQGERYILTFINNGVDMRRSWISTCGNNVPSTFKGNLSTVLFLMKGQIPNYTQLTQNVQLY